MMPLRALFAVLMLPGIFAGILPWAIAAYDPGRVEGHVAGLAVIAVGACIVAACVRDFFVIGRGTLAPWDPPRRLVVVGLYRYVRNPMYVGVLAVIAGTAIDTGSPAVLAYAVVAAIGFHLRVVLYEEPHLAAQFGEDWAAYSRKVRRWPCPQPGC
jgi:protein-S-isoprenylcysteine O-methyltransferase Ste14